MRKLLLVSLLLVPLAALAPREVPPISNTEPLLFPTTPPPPPHPVALRRVISGLERPTSIVHAGDGRLFITEQGGLIRILEGSRLRPEPFLDVRSLVTSGGEQGLLGLAFHPRYAQNGIFFVDYTNPTGAVTVARYRVSADPNRADPGSARVLLTVPKPFGNHNGGQLAFGPDGYLYVGIGDGGGGGDPMCLAQQGTTLLGKILRLDVDANADSPPFYGIPSSNPFQGSHPFPDEIWAFGLRNPWRFSFDRRTGDLYIGDVGQDLREEIDVQPARSSGGQNYGWKTLEGTFCFSTDACPSSTPPCGSPQITLPALEYRHTSEGECSVTGGYVSRGTTLPHAYGFYFFGDLCNGRIWSAERRGSSWQVRELPQRARFLTTFGEDRSGELYLATLEGSLYQLVPQHPVDTVGLYDPARSRFLLKNLHLAGAADRTVRFGPAGRGWLPVTGDWNGDGRTTIGLYDPGTSSFRLKNALAGGAADILVTVVSPSPGALPLAGDWDGDGRDSIGLYDPATSTFHLKNSLTNGGFEISFVFGAGGLPIAGDWDGDGRDTVGLYSPAQSIFRFKNSLSGGTVDSQVRFGPAGGGRLPLAGDWDGDGRDSIGLYDPATSTFSLKNTIRRGPADHQLQTGTAGVGWKPIAGEW